MPFAIHGPLILPSVYVRVTCPKCVAETKFFLDDMEYTYEPQEHCEDGFMDQLEWAKCIYCGYLSRVYKNQWVGM